MKTVLITGANRGIGLELVKQYLSAGYDVYAACRKTSNELSATAAHIIQDIDVSEPAGVESLKAQVPELDILINNAGILRDEVLGQLNYATIEEQWKVNTLGPLKVTEALLEQLRDGGKIAFVSSRMGSIADNTSGGRYGYRMSKAALNAAAVSVAHDVAHRNISVAILHPGYVQTDMVGGRGEIPASEAAQRLFTRIDQLDMSNSGTFWHSNGSELPW
ncbi:short-chain dehydrogenase [Vibrio albus]|uniref:Short-chain dehydrogenase n=1 Tax=Vibrio albus TaxID=2200953 RepID=A0A2U3BAM1_9VIBR|nr:SDR family oxidoreductase [Vibrio albus]PWI33842.1 short-chain dehydrogenase [Vibrio albus]